MSKLRIVVTGLTRQVASALIARAPRGRRIDRACGRLDAMKAGTTMRTKEWSDLSARTVASLDFARASAASYVVLHHLAADRGWSNGPCFVLGFGQEAVILFFLLSGFVIFANERARAVDPKGYYLRRLRRIYPALIAAMLISTLVAIDNGTFVENVNFKQLFGTLLGLQDLSRYKPGVIIDPYLENSPLWSLSYEVAFYIAFPPVLRMWLHRPLFVNNLIGIFCCFSYVSYSFFPNHWSLVTEYFLVWWCGAMAAEAHLRVGKDVRSMGSSLYWLLLLSLTAAATILFVGYHGPGFYPFLMFRHFAFAAFTLVVLFGPIGRRLGSRLQRISKFAAAVASVSYGLYLFHVPLLVDWRRASTGQGLLAAMLVLAAAAYILDRQLSCYLPRAPIT